MSRFNLLGRFVAGVCFAAGLSAPAAGSILQFAGDMTNSTEGYCNFDGEINYNFLGGTLGEVTFTLTNTTDADIGGYLTGFVFNVGGFTVDLDLVSVTHPFDELTNESASPFGTYRSGAALGGNWTGGGNPKPGIAVGDTGVFQFNLDSADAALLNAGTFLSGESDFNFVVRFRGLNNGGSDKVPSNKNPTPGAAALLGLASLTATRRRRA